MLDFALRLEFGNRYKTSPFTRLNLESIDILTLLRISEDRVACLEETYFPKRHLVYGRLVYYTIVVGHVGSKV
jgi:hypothetical protein